MHRGYLKGLLQTSLRTWFTISYTSLIEAIYNFTHCRKMVGHRRATLSQKVALILKSVILSVILIPLSQMEDRCFCDTPSTLSIIHPFVERKVSNEIR